MTDISPLCERLASPDYWQDALPTPGLQGKSTFKDQISASRHFADISADKVRGLYEDIESNDHVKMPVFDGQVLPLMGRGLGLLRVVTDACVSPVSTSSFARWFFKQDQEISVEEFEEMATAMTNERLYTGETARMTVQGTGHAVRVFRDVTYYTGSVSGDNLDGIPSYNIPRSSGKVLFTRQIPQLTVGQAYVSGDKRNRYTKIVQAEILKQGGRQVKAPRRVILPSLPIIRRPGQIIVPGV